MVCPCDLFFNAWERKAASNERCAQVGVTQRVFLYILLEFPILGGSHHAHEVDLEQLNSLVEDKDMLSENLENLVQKERQEGRQEERREAEQRALESGSLSEAQLYQPTL